MGVSDSLQRLLKSSFAGGVVNETLSLLKKFFPNIYDAIEQEPSGFLAFWVGLEAYLLETANLTGAALLKERFLGTASSTEALLNHAVEAGYKDFFAVPPSGKVKVYVPFYSPNGELLFSVLNTTFDKTSNTLSGLKIGSLTEKVPYALKYTYRLEAAGDVILAYRENEDGSTISVPVAVSDFTDENNRTYKCIVFEADVEQVETYSVSVTAQVTSDGLLTVPLSGDVENLAGVEVYVDGEKAEFYPLMALFPDDSYAFTIRVRNGTPLVVLSNGLFGKKIIPGQRIDVVYKTTLGAEGNCEANSLAFDVAPINAYTGLPIQTFLEHPAFTGGRSLRLKKSDIFASLRTQERCITQEDYIELIQRDKGLEAIAYAGTLDFASAEVKVYVAPIKQASATTPEYYKTSTRHFVLTEEQISSLPSSGSYYYISSVLFKESESVPTFANFTGLSPDSVEEDTLISPSNLWLPFALIRFNPDYPELSEIWCQGDINPLGLTETKQAAFRGSLVQTSLLTLSTKLDTTSTSPLELSGSISLTFKGGTAYRSLLDGDLEAVLSIQDSAGILSAGTLQYSVVSTDNNTAFITFSVSIPVTGIKDTKTDLTISVQLKDTYGSYTIATFERKNASLVTAFPYPLRIASVTAVKSIFQEDGFDTSFFPNDGVVLYDIPTVALEEYLENPSVTYTLQSLLLDINRYLRLRTPAGATPKVLLAHTFGRAFYKSPITGERMNLTLPFDVAVSILPLGDYAQALSDAKNAILTSINDKSNRLLSGLDTTALITAITAAGTVASATVQTPSQSLPVVNTEELSPAEFRAFVPFVFYTTPGRIVVSRL